MTNDSFEFGCMSKSEKRKVLVSKLVLAVLISFCFIVLVLDETLTPSSNLILVSGALGAIFGYINLLNIKSKLMELFEPPYAYIGYEFIIVSMILNITSFFI